MKKKPWKKKESLWNVPPGQNEPKKKKTKQNKKDKKKQNKKKPIPPQMDPLARYMRDPGIEMWTYAVNGRAVHTPRDEARWLVHLLLVSFLKTQNEVVFAINPNQ